MTKDNQNLEIDKGISEVSYKLFNIDKFQNVVNQIQQEKGYSIKEISEYLDIPYQSLFEYLDNEDPKYPEPDRYKKIYTNIRTIYTDSYNVINEFYFCNRKKINEFNLQEFLYIHGFTINETKDRLYHDKQIPYDHTKVVLYGNNSSVIQDKDIVKFALGELSKILKVELYILESIFYENSNKIKSKIDSNIVLFSQQLSYDLKKYREDSGLSLVKLSDEIYKKTNIKISYNQLDHIIKQKAKSVFPINYIALRNFLSPKLEGEELLLKYTTYKSVTDMSLSELLYVSGYFPKDMFNKIKDKNIFKNLLQFKNFLSCYTRQNISYENKQKVYQAISELIKTPIENIIVVFKNTKNFQSTTNRDKFLLRKSRKDNKAQEKELETYTKRKEIKLPWNCNRGVLETIDIEIETEDDVNSEEINIMESNIYESSSRKRKGKAVVTSSESISDTDESLEYISESENLDIGTLSSESSKEVSREDIGISYGRNKNDRDTINHESYEVGNKGKSIVKENKKAIIDNVYKLISEVSEQNTYNIRYKYFRSPTLKRPRNVNIIQKEIKDIIFFREQREEREEQIEDSIFIGESSSNKKRKPNFVVYSDSEDSENNMEGVTSFINDNSTNKRLINIGNGNTFNITVNKYYNETSNNKRRR